MLTKGIILEKVINSNKYIVRIPFLESSGVYTRTTYEAILAYNPSITEELKVGDVVILGFEEHTATKPVILGKLFTNESETRGHASFESLDVSNTVNLPDDTTIGGVDILEKINKLDNISVEGGDSIHSVYNDDTALTNLDVVDNTDYTYQLSINSAVSFTIPAGIKQGFLSLMTLNSVSEGITLTFINNSSYDLRIVNGVYAYDSSTYVTGYTGRKILMFRCDGHYIEATIVEERD